MSRFLKFMIPSFIGVLLFIVPVPYEDSFSVVVGIAAQMFQTYFASYLPRIVTLLLILTAVFSILALKVPLFKASSTLRKTFVVSSFVLWIRIVSAILCTLCLFKWGPLWLSSQHTGGLLLYDLLPILFSVFLFASFLLALLVNFGLLEFFGTLLSKVMRPLFKLPGRSAIDCLTSWVGDGTIGILLTSKQYESGHYSAREAAAIGTTFSVVSITFSIVVISQVKLSHMFVPFYATVTVAGIACALILPRIPPLSWKKDNYCKKLDKDHEDQKESPLLEKALSSAMRQANANTFMDFLKTGCANLLEMWSGILPIVMTVGTGALLIAEFTPTFVWLGKPFIPFLELLHIPEAQEASQSIVAGFADMFLPVILGSNIESELTRFVIACTSVTQLIFMTETGALLLGSKIPVSFIDLCLIFLLRTLISLPIISLMAHTLFF